MIKSQINKSLVFNICKNNYSNYPKIIENSPLNQLVYQNKKNFSSFSFS